ncbi:hypothetical protein GCM10011374_38500 [Kocuria dechangensis]|uniref:HTH cro/C1-type domain-containing protein n=1 Tax=Kocuria dechangensis TaxID=1176249 RepID=A0A917M1B9_9MICC|nr:helix-turn-helix transcriptional regulator [Kocuria dechangensis]GGG70271.1 hypothetical protein GCM10011374_38500 [Kocuria dechangensis]
MSTVAEVLGHNVKRLRQERGWTLDDLARAGHTRGHKWNTGRISKIERGNTAPTIELLLVLALSFEVPPVELLRTEEEVELGEGEFVTGQALVDVFTGRTTELEVRDVPGAEDRLKKQLLGVTVDMQEVQQITGETFNFRQHEAARKAYGLTDERAAKKLGMTDNQLLGWSLRLWGKVLSQEVEERAGQDATAQKKGHVTRALVKELADATGKR